MRSIVIDCFRTKHTSYTPFLEKESYVKHQIYGNMLGFTFVWKL